MAWMDVVWLMGALLSVVALVVIAFVAWLDHTEPKLEARPEGAPSGVVAQRPNELK